VRRRYVLFGPLAEADAWRTGNPGVRDKDILYVWADHRSLRGLSARDTTVVRLKGAWASPSFGEIDPLLKLLETGAQ
jgi:hypothetical protein